MRPSVLFWQTAARAKRIILANGGTPRKLGIPGEKELAGKGMGMNAARDGAAYAGKMCMWWVEPMVQ